MNLETTNLLLGIMAAVSVLEAVALVGAGVAGFLAYRKVMTLVEGLEQRQIVPLLAQVNTILADVKGVTSRVSEETERADHAIRGTIDRVDEAAVRVRSTVRVRASRLVGIVRGIRVAIEALLSGPGGPRTRAEAPGQP
jgi:hypothetical protein